MRDEYIPKDDWIKIEQSITSHTATKDTLVILLLHFTGIRCCELVTLSKDNFDLAKRKVFIRAAKRGRSRYIPLPNYAPLISAIRAFQSTGAKSIGELFSSSITPITQERTVMRRLNSFIERALGRKHNYKSHSFRHTLARDFLKSMPENPEALRFVQKQLGHVSVANTTRYLDSITDEQSQEALEAMWSKL